MLFVILILLLMLFVCTPYVNVVLKRRRMLKHVTATARASGFRVRYLHRFVCLSPNRLGAYDVLFESRSRAIAVKLWSAVKKDGALVIRENGTFYRTRTVPEPFEPNKKRRRELRSGVRRVAVTRKNFKLKKDKPLTKVLLYYPPDREIAVQLADGRVGILEMGDRVFDKLLCSPSRLEAMLKAEAGAESTSAVKI